MKNLKSATVEKTANIEHIVSSPSKLHILDFIVNLKHKYTLQSFFICIFQFVSSTVYFSNYSINIRVVPAGFTVVVPRGGYPASHPSSDLRSVSIDTTVDHIHMGGNCGKRSFVFLYSLLLTCTLNIININN